jgi:ABC-type transport system involved in cytochrome bd biosynthesis fused ATPase/permease subunit
MIWRAMGADEPRPHGRVGFLPRDPVFPSRELWQLVGLADPSGPTNEEKKTLRRIGAWSSLREISKNWRSKVASSEVSTGQARLIALSKLLLGGGGGAWVLDGVLEGASKKVARARLAEILRLAAARTVAVSALAAFEPEQFDRVIALRRGRVAFDGTPDEWANAETERA